MKHRDVFSCGQKCNFKEDKKKKKACKGQVKWNPTQDGGQIRAECSQIHNSNTSPAVNIEEIRHFQTYPRFLVKGSHNLQNCDPAAPPWPPSSSRRAGPRTGLLSARHRNAR